MSADLQAIFEEIKKQIQEEKIRFTQHAHQKMVEEEFTLDKVLKVVLAGTILENYPEHRRGACCLVGGTTQSGRPVHVVCTTAQPVLIIITVLRTQTTKMVNPNAKEAKMNCSIKGCPGEYEEHTVVHTVRYRGQVVVIDHVPAEICTVCGDVLLKPETVRQIEVLLQTANQPASMIPLYEFV